MRLISIATFSLVLGLSLPAFAEEPAKPSAITGPKCLHGKQTKLNLPDGFTPAKPTQKILPPYPFREENKFGEGWVLLEYGVDVNGKPQDVRILDRLGSKSFGAVALKAAGEWQYAPAAVNGKPVAQFGINTIISFRFRKGFMPMEGSESKDRLKTAQNHLDAGRTADAIAVFEKGLGESSGRSSMTLKELTVFSFGLGVAYWKEKDGLRALPHIRRAMLSDEAFLSEDQNKSALALHDQLNLMNGDYAIVDCRDPAKSQHISADMAGAVKQIEAVLADPGPIAVPGTLAPDGEDAAQGVWRHVMLRRKFAFNDVNDNVKTFKLTCTTQALEAKIDPNNEWTIPDSAGFCRIDVFGHPGATVTLVEAW